MAHAYGALNPQRSVPVLDSFLNTVWLINDTTYPASRERIEQWQWQEPMLSCALQIIQAAARSSPAMAIFTAVTGASFVVGLMQFSLQISQADVNDDGPLRRAGNDLAQVMLDEAGLASGIAGAFRFIPRAINTLKILKLARSWDEVLAVGNFLGKFGQNEAVLNLIDNADDITKRRLVDVAVTLFYHSSQRVKGSQALKARIGR